MANIKNWYYLNNEFIGFSFKKAKKIWKNRQNATLTRIADKPNSIEQIYVNGKWEVHDYAKYWENEYEKQCFENAKDSFNKVIFSDIEKPKAEKPIEKQIEKPIENIFDLMEEYQF